MNPTEKALDKSKGEKAPEKVSGTTNGLVKALYKFKSLRPIASKIDRMTYKPYRGYNRLRSEKWNLEHTLK